MDNRITTEDYFIHWTDEDNLREILDPYTTDVMHEGTSFTDTLYLPFDIDNDKPFGLRFNSDLKEKLHQEGQTWMEMKHEFRADSEVDISTYLEGFVVRNESNKRWLQKILQDA